MDNENILDESFINLEKDESKINKVVGIIRYMLCGYLGATYLKLLIKSGIPTVTIDKSATIIGYIIAIILIIWFFYYNVKHAQLERAEKFVNPVFSRGSIIVFLCYTLVYILLFLNRIYLNIVADGIATHLITPVLLVIFFVIIFAREIAYLKRSSQKD